MKEGGAPALQVGNNPPVVQGEAWRPLLDGNTITGSLKQTHMPRLMTAVKAIRELGPSQVGLFALYRLGKRAGYYRRRPRPPRRGDWRLDLSPLGKPPDREALETVLAGGRRAVFEEAEAILTGEITLFGSVSTSLDFSQSKTLRHWTFYDNSLYEGRDVKWAWEPARFGWAFALGRAYLLSGDERFPEAFWRNAEDFWRGNPPYLGPQWVSGQEVGLRLLAMVFAAWIFTPSGPVTPERAGCISNAIAVHATRIPPTLLYARAQDNNHLLTEAAALYTAGLVLPTHPRAPRWRALGWRWFHRALQNQIEPDGTYIQQSTNYHRLMLHTALWVARLSLGAGDRFPEGSRSRLGAATRWLLPLLDPSTGRVPNLGPNDGARILPLSVSPFYDFRPVLQAASLAFTGQPALESGPWDDLGIWLGFTLDEKAPAKRETRALGYVNTVVRHPTIDSWAYLRAAQFTHRPGHIDQLHLDLWWRGLNVAQDAGTYLYNAPPPWDNALTAAAVHNTVTVDGQDQMTRAGRFLYVDRAQAVILEQTPSEITAEHNGYRRLGITHRRSVQAGEGGWVITDELYPVRPSPRAYAIRLHWLVPDWPWEADGLAVRLRSPLGWVTLSVTGSASLDRCLVRAGELIEGSGPCSPVWGWASPTYGVRQPALSFAFLTEASLPVKLTCQWTFEQGSW